MLGAIVGDIVGSRFEFDNIKTKEFVLFKRECFVTDDSIMTLAIGKAIMECKGNYLDLGSKAVQYMQLVGRPYLNCGYGGNFYQWLYSENPKPYMSFGNGAAMRISACGLIATSLEDVKMLSAKVTEVSHNHPEGMKGAEATAVCIFMAKQGKTKKDIRDYVAEHYYPMDFTLDEIRDEYYFNETCQNTVPQAIMAFLESTDFEDGIRNAVSIGGDSDTLAAITGSILEAYYGIPETIKEKAVTYLDDRLRSVYDEWVAFIVEKNSKE